MGALESTGGGPRALRGGILVVALAVGLLLATAHLFDPGRLHVIGNFVDQAQYVTTARHWLDTGELRSGLVYPAYADEPGWRPYMPGSYVPLVASFALLGWGPLQAILPSLLGYVLACLGLYLLGVRLYDRGVGVAAALLYALHPGNLNYAFTAMAEQAFTGLCVLTFAAFVFLPARWRPVAAPLLLVPAFLFRETAALYVIPMALVLVHRGPPGVAPAAPAGRRVLTAAAACAVAVLVLFALDRWQVAQGKASLLTSWIAGGGFNYSDAFAPPPPELSARGWVESALANGHRNVRMMIQLFRVDATHVRVVGWVLTASAIVFSTVVGIVRWRRDPLPLAAGLLGLVMVALLFLLYDVKYQKAMRGTFFVYPLCALTVAATLRPADRFGRAVRAGGSARAGALVLVAALVAGSYASARQGGRELAGNTHVPDTALEALEALQHDETSLLVAPVEIIMSFAVRRYPARVSLPPANEETLELLMRRFRVGTLVLQSRSPATEVSEAFLQRHGFVRIGRIRTDDEYDGPEAPTRLYHAYRQL